MFCRARYAEEHLVLFLRLYAGQYFPNRLRLIPSWGIVGYYFEASAVVRFK